MFLKIFFFIFSYLLGNILGGKIISIIYKEDFTEKGSGNIGARNAGRILGPKAFLFVGLIDFFKGFLVIILLKLLNTDNITIAVAIFLVVLGHIKPILNKFKGGKGVATFLGTIVALSPNLVFVLILGFLLISFITRSITIGFYSTLPALISINYLELKSISFSLIFIAVIVMLILVAKKDIELSFNKYFNPIRKNKNKIIK